MRDHRSDDELRAAIADSSRVFLDRDLRAAAWRELARAVLAASARLGPAIEGILHGWMPGSRRSAPRA